MLARVRALFPPALTSGERALLERAAKNDPQLRGAIPPRTSLVPQQRTHALAAFSHLR